MGFHYWPWKNNRSLLNIPLHGPISQENAIPLTLSEQKWVCFDTPSKISWGVDPISPALRERLQISLVDSKSWDETQISADARRVIFCQFDSLILNDTGTAWLGHLHHHILPVSVLECSGDELSRPPNTPVTYRLKKLLPPIRLPGKNTRVRASRTVDPGEWHPLFSTPFSNDIKLLTPFARVATSTFKYGKRK